MDNKEICNITGIKCSNCAPCCGNKAINKINTPILQEVIDFFEISDGWDKKEVIAEILGEIKELKNYSADEIGLEWDNKCLMTLDDFSGQFFDKVSEGICNVLKSFQKGR
jgi:hypothetical protein